ncbi:hypothetical protein K2173_018344 [Erythroxylum novogranatense]|uniref:GPI transamidase component PIG-T n=1 Tax=Erythroxylum novogranatense TaxID=1862640 RepID=A0AAV8UA59_9ROSI|nr:hypothetical protein K2173_018344 [Erythroxylum novogranatense]
MAATLSRRWVLSLFLVLSTEIVFRSKAVVEEQRREEEFYEELLLRPLPDRKVLAHFHFESRAPPSASNGRHHHLFPKAISQLVQKFHVKEMELSFTQGRWNYERWGGFDPVSSRNAKPPGIELWAVFDAPQGEIDACWKNLTHALSGIFCASINFLESSTMYSAPEWSFRPASGNLRHGFLPREAVCTENLTPWLKLLPCRDKAGLSVLLDRPSIYRGFYHSQRLHLTSNGHAEGGMYSGIFLEQTLTIALQPSSRGTSLSYSSERNLQPSWSLSSIFGRKVTGRCVVAKSSNVYLQFERDLVAQLKNLENHGMNNKSFGNYLSKTDYELSINPDVVYQEEAKGQGKSPSVLYEFSIEKYSDSQPFDLGLKWKIPVIWSCQQAPLHGSRFLMGSGNERGAIAILLRSTASNEDLGTNGGDECKLQVDIFQVVPWYIKVYYHTLQLFVDEKPKATGDFMEKIHIVPSKDKISPGVMEMVLKFPCSIKSAAIKLEFDKGFLHIDEYPPDANQGFDIPSAVISFPDFQTSIPFPNHDNKNSSNLLSIFQERSPVLSYTEVLLVPLTTPDFSMPYNVITITCTVFALYFGSLLNVLRRRVGEEERFLKSKAISESGQLHMLLSKLSAKLRGKAWEPSQPSCSSTSSMISSKLVMKVILVAAFAVAWKYYLD